MKPHDRLQPAKLTQHHVNHFVRIVLPYGHEIEKGVELSSWGFLSVFDFFQQRATNGTEIKLTPGVPPALSAILGPALDRARFSCSLAPGTLIEAHWTPVATNKFGDCVSGFYSEDSVGTVLLLPHISKSEDLVLQLVEEWLPTRNPKLFPFNEGTHWIRNVLYEPPRVVELSAAIATERTRAAAEIARLEAEIEKERHKYHNDAILLAGTGSELVAAVLAALREFGFKNLIDVDAVAAPEEKVRGLREDIQVHDAKPILVVDVKGIGGTPTDEDARQSEKHALMRMHDWKSHEVKPLTIINHQRYLPPHERAEPYRDELINAAKQTHLGLITTFDLWRLLRGFRRYGWQPEHVAPIFYADGRIDPTPSHYIHAGAIVHVWKAKNAVGIIPEMTITDKTKLAFVVAFDFVESEIASLMVEGKRVAEAPAGSNCGIALAESVAKLKEGQRVFLVQSTS